MQLKQLIEALFAITFVLITNLVFSQTTNKTDKSCGCDYFPLCKPDVTKSFMGQTWKGFNNDGKITYYLCTNGILKAKYELFDNFEGNSLGYSTYIALKYNLPEGSTWDETVNVNGAKYYYHNTIVKKPISVRINGVVYKDVIKLHREVKGASMFIEGEPISTIGIEDAMHYFAKDVGELNAEEVEELVLETNKQSNSENNNVQSEIASLRGRLISGEWYCDTSIVDPATKKTIKGTDILKFSTDGTYSSQTFIDGKNVVSLNGKWKINQNLVEMYPDFDDKLIFDFAIDEKQGVAKFKKRFGGKVYQIYKQKSSKSILTLLTDNMWTCETGTHAGKMSYRFASSGKVYFYYFLNGKYGWSGRAEWKLYNLEDTYIINVGGQGEFQLKKNDKNYYFESRDCKHVPVQITDNIRSELNKLETF